MGFLTAEEEENMSAKDKRMMKMLQEDLVDPDKMMAKPRRVKVWKLFLNFSCRYYYDECYFLSLFLFTLYKRDIL
jgi:hypothetical protein